FGLLDPVVQRLRGAADLRRNRHDRLPARRVLTLVVENQPHRALAHFRGKRVRRLAHDAPSYSGVGASGKPGAVQTQIRSGLMQPVKRGSEKILVTSSVEKASRSIETRFSSLVAENFGRGRR